MALAITWAGSDPADGDLISAGAGEIRSDKRAVAERVGIDHRMSGTNDSINNSAQCGYHNKSTYIGYAAGSDPAVYVSGGIAYVMNDGSAFELFFKDAADNEIQLTDAGSLKVAGSALTDGKIFVGNGSDLAAAVTPSGDVSLSNAGVATVTDLTIASEAANDTIYFNGSNWVRRANGIDGNIVSYNASESSVLSATSTANTYVDTGLTAITFTPAQATNIIVVNWGVIIDSTGGNLSTDAAPYYGGSVKALYASRSATTAAGGTTNIAMTGSFTVQLAASSQTFKLYFKNPEASGTMTATDAYLHITEYNYSS